jgi:putative heme-binding domain-containing protein
VLCYWHDRVQSPLELLRVQINDDHPRVRLEAVRALSFFHNEAAIGVALEMLAHPDDEYLRFTFNETLNTLERRAGAKVDRKNIASSLLTMIEKGKIPAERQAALLETICRHGDAKDLTVVWEKALQPDAYPLALRKRVLEWLTDAAITRHAQPKVAGGAFAKLLGLTKDDAVLLPDAIRLAAALKEQEAIGAVQEYARAEKTPPAARAAAIEALATFADASSVQTLRDLSVTGTPMAARFRAATALGQVDLAAGANAAAAAIAGAGDKDDPAVMIQAFLVRKGGSDKLAAALAKQKVSVDNAKRVLRAMYLAGRNDTALGEVASKFAGLDAAPKAPTSQEVAKIGADAVAQGDAARGEHIFRRADIGCIKCHSIGKVGGNIGPDLGPVGGTSPMDYIVSSILDPNAAIKEEYLTKVIATASGQVVTGIVVERSKNQVVLKDATGKLVRIPTADIDDETPGKSLMPEGVTRILTRAELLDLIRFVSELGKPGPFLARDPAVVHRWKRLRDVPPVLAEGVPNLEVIRDSVLRTGPEAWDTAYTLVNGNLPLGELLRPGQPPVLYLQADVNVVQAGPVEIQLTAPGAKAFWIDEQPFEKQTNAVVPLSVGRHRITVRVAAGEAPGSTVRLELRKPADSKVHFEVVTGE